MRVMRAYKTELDLNNEQITACTRHAGAARSADNWGLARKQEAYTATGTSPAALDRHRALNALKPSELRWMYQVSKCAPPKKRCASWTLPSRTASAAARASRTAS